MREFMRSLRQSEMAIGSSKLFSGSAVAQILTLAAAVILARLYTPADFGALATFVAVCGLLSPLVTARYELGIMLPDRDVDALRLAAVALWITLAVASAALLAVAVLRVTGSSVLSDLGVWAFLIPVTLLATGANAVFSAYAMRTGMYGLVAKTNVARTMSGTSVQLGLGVLTTGPGGLILGNLVGSAAANVRMGRPVLRGIRSDRPSREQLLQAAKRFSQFPRHTLPANMVNSAAIQGVALTIQALFGAAALGQWYLAQKVVLLPLTLLGDAVRQTYYRRAVQLRQNRELSMRLFHRLILLMGLGTLPVFVAIALIAPWLVPLIFGDNWDLAGSLVALSTPWLWARLVASPLSVTTLVYERNAVGLWIQLWLLAVLASSGGAAWVLGWEVQTFVAVLSGLNALSYLGFLAIWQGMIKKGYSLPDP